MSWQRIDGRLAHERRPLRIVLDAFGYADASVYLELGSTKVLVSVTLQQGVPPFLKGQKKGWLTAEYAMLPTSTTQRSVRESHQGQRNYRNIEISRLIGRCLRSIIDLNQIGERSIFVDCDVLQADGSTRVACLTAASIALEQAVQRWVHRSVMSANVLTDSLAALSLGIIDGVPVVDLSYHEDSQAHADFNFVMTKRGALVEIQGTAEQKPLSVDLFDQLKDLAQSACKTLFDDLAGAMERAMVTKPSEVLSHRHIHEVKSPPLVSHHIEKGATGKSSQQGFFSLGQRLSKSS